MRNISRRSIVASLAVAPVLSLPSVAAATSPEPDPVIRLCKAWHEFHDYFQTRSTRSFEIMNRVRSAMPMPDPSIIPGPHTEALRIKEPEYFGSWLPPHGALEPRYIESALFYVQPSTITIIEEAPGIRKLIEHDKPQPLSEGQQQKHDMLTHMLELSREYFAEYKRRLTAAGYDDGDDDVDHMADRQHVIERAIRIKPARTREGLLAKIDMFESAPDTFTSEEIAGGLMGSILRDTRRLLVVRKEVPA